jgi:hypothetical protein
MTSTTAHVARIVRQAASFGLAAVFTIAMLGSIDLLAVQPAADQALVATAASAPAQS